MNLEQIKLLEETIQHKNDRIPVALIADSPWIPGYCGHTFIDYYARNDVWMADNRKIRKDFPDAIFVPGWWVEYGMTAEPTGFGCPTCFFDDNLPHLHSLEEDIDKIEAMVDNLQLPDPKSDGLMPLLLNQQRHYQPQLEADGDQVYMVCARGPFTVASHMITVTTLCMLPMIYPDVFDKLITKTSECVKRWLEAQLENVKTAKAIMVLDDVCGFYGPEDFQTQCFPYMQKLFAQFPEVSHYFHNDNTTNCCYPHLTDMGVDVFNFTHLQDIAETRRMAGDKLVLMGNVPPMLLTGNDSQAVYDATRKTIETYVNENGSHKGLMLSTGGGLPMGATQENINALLQAVKDFNATL